MASSTLSSHLKLSKYSTAKISGSTRAPKSLSTVFCSYQTEHPCSSCGSGVAQPRLVLHDSLVTAGIDTTHAMAARRGFCDQIGRLSEIHGDTSIAISKGADLGRAVLFIGAEDDSLISHSSVPLPVDSFVDRLDNLSMGFSQLFLPPSKSMPEVFLSNLERYLFVHKGFRRVDETSDSRSLYLHSALTCHSGSGIMLSLIYSEMLKMLRVYGLLEFDAEIHCPLDLIGLPRGFLKKKSKFSDQFHIVTAKSLLVDILSTLKRVFWPFGYGNSGSLFLRAIHATSNVLEPSFSENSYSKLNSNSAMELAAAKAGKHRLDRGIWTNVHFGDMRRALAACERLILMKTSREELRDYAVLLYHCRHYAECLDFLKLYKTLKESQSNDGDRLEVDAVDRLIARVKLILDEEGWTKKEIRRSYWENCLEPW